MRTKLIYTGLVGLLASSGISNAMERERLSLTDGKQTGSQLTPYQGSSSNRVLTENVDFTNASKENFARIVQFPNGGRLGVQALCQYIGPGRQIFGNFMDDLENFMVNYDPENRPNRAPQKEIVISQEDTSNIENFAKFAYNLFSQSFDAFQEVTDGFKSFKNNNECAYDNFQYDVNSIIFAMMFYTGQVKFNPKGGYCNSTFTFTPCPEKESDKKIDIHFNHPSVPMSSEFTATIDSNSDNILSAGLYIGHTVNFYNKVWGKYQFTAFKVDQSAYHLNIKLFAKDDIYSRHDEKLRKAANFLLEIKPK